mmetsp:Transcript_19903/g.64788  ORF Transcript_19903/g.64788 Transcript_19903/m.64788 type:complete len:439 (+) Transcript_19903:1248-2564(+)
MFHGTPPFLPVRPLFQIQRPTELSAHNEALITPCSCTIFWRSLTPALSSSSLLTCARATLTSAVAALASRSEMQSCMSTFVERSCFDAASERDDSSRSIAVFTAEMFALWARAAFTWVTSAFASSMVAISPLEAFGSWSSEWAVLAAAEALSLASEICSRSVEQRSSHASTRVVAAATAACVSSARDWSAWSVWSTEAESWRRDAAVPAASSRAVASALRASSRARLSPSPTKSRNSATSRRSALSWRLVSATSCKVRLADSCSSRSATSAGSRSALFALRLSPAVSSFRDALSWSAAATSAASARAASPAASSVRSALSSSRAATSSRSTLRDTSCRSFVPSSSVLSRSADTSAASALAAIASATSARCVRIALERSAFATYPSSSPSSGLAESSMLSSISRALTSLAFALACSAAATSALLALLSTACSNVLMASP